MVSLVWTLGVRLEAWRGQKMDRDQQVGRPFPTGKGAAQPAPLPCLLLTLRRGTRGAWARCQVALAL